MRTCSRCGAEKPSTEFYRRSASVDGYRGTCKTCCGEQTAAWREANRERVRETSRAWDRANASHRRHQSRRRHTGADIDPEDVERLADSQGRACAICGTHEDDLTQGLHLDHSHLSGRIRGLLCRKCNTALGLLGDEVAGLLRAVAYLSDPPAYHLETPP